MGGRARTWGREDQEADREVAGLQQPSGYVVQQSPFNASSPKAWCAACCTLSILPHPRASLASARWIYLHPHPSLFLIRILLPPAAFITHTGTNIRSHSHFIFISSKILHNYRNNSSILFLTSFPDLDLNIVPKINTWTLGTLSLVSAATLVLRVISTAGTHQVQKFFLRYVYDCYDSPIHHHHFFNSLIPYLAYLLYVHMHVLSVLILSLDLDYEFLLFFLESYFAHWTTV
jgi:hypothetical protein